MQSYASGEAQGVTRTDLMKRDLITILGPTASGKTALAAALASDIGAEIISGDSRQVYRDMDLGTGKDLDDYIIRGRRVPYHLIDIVEPGYKYNVFEFQRDFLQAYLNIKDKGKEVILCGGSGLYIESVLRGYRLIPVPENPELRARLEGKSLDELTRILAGYKTLHNSTDVDTPKRAVRAIEIEEHYLHQTEQQRAFPKLNSFNVGLNIDRESRRKKISDRLRKRLEMGMIDEVRNLLQSGLTPDELIYYGLEYKFVTLYVIGQISYSDMFSRLETAIHQFAKRQMTWFRGMERRGIYIDWIDADLNTDDKINLIMERMEKWQ